MKRFYLLLFLLLICDISIAQLYIREDSFRQVDKYVMNDRENHIDGNGKPMALIKISTENISAEERNEFFFKGNLETDLKWFPKIGEIYLYLTAQSATFIEIKHNNYGKKIFYLPEDGLCDFCCYELTIGRDMYPVNEDLYGYLIINTDQEDALIYVNERYVGKHSIKEPLAIDTTYTWKVKCPYYYTESGVSNIVKGVPCQIDLNLRPSHGNISVISSPLGASVFINDEYVGETPYTSDKMESGDYILEVKKEGYHSQKTSVSISDGILTEEKFSLSEKGKFFIGVNYAYSISPQHSYGFTLGKVKKVGWYVSVMSNFNFEALSYNYTCDKAGSSSGGVNYFSGRTAKTRYSVIAGVIVKVSKPVCMKIGAGYGNRTLSWETINNMLVKNTGYSYSGIDANIGFMVLLGKLTASIDFVSTNFKSFETKLGIGWVF